MGEKIAHGDRRAEGFRDLEIDIGVYILVEFDLALLDELHHRRPGEQLRNRAGADERRGRIHRLSGFNVGVAVALAGQEFPVLDDRNHGACDVEILKRIRHDAVEPGVDILLRQGVRTF